MRKPGHKQSIHAAMIYLERIEKLLLSELSQVKMLLRNQCTHPVNKLVVKRFPGIPDMEVTCGKCNIMLRRISWTSVNQGKSLTDKQAINYYLESG